MIFVFIFIRDIDLRLSFLVMPLSGFGIRVILTPQNDLRTIPSSTLFGGDLRTDGNSLIILENLRVKLTDSQLLLVVSF